MPVVKQKFVFREDLRNNPNVLYLFGDNNARTGFGGQAKEMRGEPNAVGVRTKWLPTMDAASFFDDSQLNIVYDMLNADLARPRFYLRSGGIVVIPADGLGTGLSELPKRAPKIHSMLETWLDALESYGPR